MKSPIHFSVTVTLLLAATALHGGIKVLVEHNPNDNATAGFRFKTVPPPSAADAATRAAFTIVEGERDPNGATVEGLHDGRVPTEDDQPSANLFFAAGTDGGRIVADLGRVVDIRQVNTYSWHPGTRAPQVYRLYAGDGGNGFNPAPKKGIDPETCGWKPIATVDTREDKGGGQFGVSAGDTNAPIGAHRFLLFDIARTEYRDPFGNTFYSEIDVIDAAAPAVGAASETPSITRSFETEGGKYQVTIDSTAAPDLADWVDRELTPVVRQWYPKLVRMLPSDGYEAPARVSIVFREGMGRTPAAASGSRISCNIDWFRSNLTGEARGAVVHEMVHVVQQYGRARRNNPDATRPPGWLVEGIPDYIRWFLYEPETKGAEITARNLARARYDANYRITANFLNWVTQTQDKDIIRKLNAAAREGRYVESLWKDYTGKTVQELGEKWKEFHTIRLRLETGSAPIREKEGPKTNPDP